MDASDLSGDLHGEVTASKKVKEWRPTDDLPVARRDAWKYTVAGEWLVVCDFPLARDVVNQLVNAYHGQAPCRALVLPGVYAEIRRMS